MEDYIPITHKDYSTIECRRCKKNFDVLPKDCHRKLCDECTIISNEYHKMQKKKFKDIMKDYHPNQTLIVNNNENPIKIIFVSDNRTKEERKQTKLDYNNEYYKKYQQNPIRKAKKIVYNKQYYQLHHHQYREVVKKWRKNHYDRVRELERNFYMKNKSKYHIYKRLRYLKKKNNIGYILSSNILEEEVNVTSNN